MGNPTLCLDFDGVVHSYTSGWQGAAVVPDPPVEGAMKFIWEAMNDFDVSIFSSRSHEPGGIDAMKSWLLKHWVAHFGHGPAVADRFSQIRWPTNKPSAFVTIDDRAVTFTGSWPELSALRSFKPWNKK